MTAKNALLDSIDWYTRGDGAPILRDDVLRFVAHRCQTAVLFNTEVFHNKPLLEFGEEMVRSGTIQLPYEDTLFCGRHPDGWRLAALCCMADSEWYWYFFREGSTVRNVFVPAGWAHVRAGHDIQMDMMIDRGKYDNLSDRIDNARDDDFDKARYYGANATGLESPVAGTRRSRGRPC